ncbi:zinc-dependent alcohol dehydrogenase [Agromyces larvae]|uniref:Alcohol dehydrogenase catalytic domain-containing protein n=1 Tax=Agromyces larvae TaxID=2929802 RepID=A0ABY4C0J2_9MICO|nr:alcohol dehydrogenase catalytic domain-containing protein [Agromyces larvae]UOE43483.1 alcohol dehydrogenase catalytic domain-containing protein [Agromyces larvae]
MRAFVITGPGEASVQEVPPPVAGPGEVVVEVSRAGVCGTDIEFFTGEMAYLHDGHARFPIRIGHEWAGRVSAVGEGVDRSWLGRRVTGDTMLGCGDCDRCRDGRHRVCDRRTEIGIRGGRPGALAEQLAVPAVALHALPDEVDDVAGALVEPGGNAWRAVHAADVRPGERVLVLGPGTIGLLCAMFVRAAGAEVHLMGRPGRSLEFARGLGFDGVWTREDLTGAGGGAGTGAGAGAGGAAAGLRWDAVIDASTSPELPALAVELVEPGQRVVCIGISGTPSRLDTRRLVLRDVRATGILSASGGLSPTIAAYARGDVDPRVLVGATVGLDGTADVLRGIRPRNAGAGPKLHVTPPTDAR